MSFCVLLILLCFLAFWNMMTGETDSDYLIMVIIGVFSLVYLAEELVKEKHRHDVRIPLVLGYFFRIALMLWDLYGRSIYMLPHSGADSEGYYHSSVKFAHGIDNGYGAMFPDVMGTIYSICGTTSRLFGQFIIVLFSVAAMHIAGAIMKELGVDRKTREISMYILCLLPNFAILSAVFMRESIIMMFIAISLYFFVRWFKRKKEWYFWAAFAAVFCSAAFHGGTVGMAVGYIVVRFVYSSRQGKLKMSASGAVMATALVFVMTFLYNNYGDKLFGKIPDIEDISDIAATYTRGGSSYARYVGNSDTPLNMILYTIPRMIYFLFSPFPWQWRGLSDVIAFCFSAMYYAVTLVRAVRYLAKGNQENREIVILLLVLAACTAFVFGWGVTNTGTATRHRDKVIVLYAVLYSLTAVKKPSEKRLSS